MGGLEKVVFNEKGIDVALAPQALVNQKNWGSCYGRYEEVGQQGGGRSLRCRGMG